MQYGSPSGETATLLCDCDVALLPPAFQGLFNPESPIGDTTRFFPKSPRFAIVFIAWLFIAPLAVVGIYLSVAHLPISHLGTMFLELLCIGTLLAITWKMVSALWARWQLAAGQWRYGLFLLDATLIIHMAPNRCFVLPRESICSIHLFQRVDMMEHVVSSGTHSHIRVVYHDADGGRQWTDIELAELEARPGRMLRMLQAWHANGTAAGNVEIPQVNVVSGALSSSGKVDMTSSKVTPGYCGVSSGEIPIGIQDSCL